MPARLRCKVIHSDNLTTKLQIWLNGDLITDQYMVVRNQDFIYLVGRLQAELILVDRENITSDLWKRIKKLPEVELI